MALVDECETHYQSLKSYGKGLSMLVRNGLDGER